MLVLDYPSLLATSLECGARGGEKEDGADIGADACTCVDEGADKQVGFLGTYESGADCSVVRDRIKHGEYEGLDMVAAIMEAMGPSGQGFVAVRGIPGYEVLRRQLLPLAKRLALMSSSQRSCVLKEHGLGTDVPLKAPDRPVSSFAAQLQFGLASPSAAASGDCNKIVSQPNVEGGEDTSLRELGSLFRQLGASMVEVGLGVARLCDFGVSRSSSDCRMPSDINVCNAGLEHAIRESGTAKGRLIHYHSFQEHSLLGSTLGATGKSKQKKNATTKKHGETRDWEMQLCQHDTQLSSLPSNLWQQWHYDYGILTVLTAPLFLASAPSQLSEDLLIQMEGSSATWKHSSKESLSECNYSFSDRGSQVNAMDISASMLSTAMDLTLQVSKLAVPTTTHIEINRKGGISRHSPIEKGGCYPCPTISVLGQNQCVGEGHGHLSRKTVYGDKVQEAEETILSSKNLLQHSCRACECPPPTGHSGLLVMDTARGKSSSVAIPPDCLIVQAGEVAQVLSGGKLVARAHCVSRPPGAGNVSRETMAVFLQPAWDRPLVLPLEERERSTVLEAGVLPKSLEKQIPPLRARWREGCTFAEFSKETTFQYYGAKGHDSTR